MNNLYTNMSPFVTPVCYVKLNKNKLTKASRALSYYRKEKITAWSEKLAMR